MPSSAHPILPHQAYPTPPRNTHESTRQYHNSTVDSIQPHSLELEADSRSSPSLINFDPPSDTGAPSSATNQQKRVNGQQIHLATPARPVL
ncbi:hypothetical protein JCM11251_007124 [Rhodosporidiobolus azoricus]